MKPLSEKTYVEQALKNQKGITWLDDCRIPIDEDNDVAHRESAWSNHQLSRTFHGLKYKDLSMTIPPQGRFPANLIVSDDVLNDGRSDKGTKPHQIFSKIDKYEGYGSITKKQGEVVNYGDSGSFSRYFSLDKWWEEKIKDLPQSVQRTFPFLISPKASKSEKNKGCEGLEPQNNMRVNAPRENEGENHQTKHSNNHPTVKPIKLMSYLVTLGSRENDIVLDPFMGSGTTLLASKVLGRKCIGIEIEEKYCEIAAKRCSQSVMKLNV